MPDAPDGYRPLGRYFQAFPPAETTWPEELIEAIRRDIDQEICPMWCWNVYRSSAGGIVKLGRNWLWRAVRDLKGPATAPRYVPACAGVNAGLKPNVELLALEKDRTPQQVEDNVAGDFMPFGWWVYDVLKTARDAYEPDYEKEANRREAEALQSQEAQQKAVLDEVHSRMDNDWKHFKANCAKLSDEELTAIQKHGIFGIPTESAPKPFVDYGART